MYHRVDLRDYNIMWIARVPYLESVSKDLSYPIDIVKEFHLPVPKP